MKKPIAVILTDTHLKEENKETNVSIFKQARLHANARGLNRVYHMGDIFESRKAQPEGILNTFGTILDEFTDEDMYLDCVPGNHDKTFYPATSSFLDPFKDHPNFQLYTEPSLTGVINGFPVSDKVHIYMAPFFADEQYIDHINKMNDDRFWKGKRVLLTHIGMDGAVMNNGVAVKSRINAELFKDFDLALIGHYHDASVYSDKIVYVGSSIQHNFGEKPGKGLTVLYDDLSIETVELEYPKYIKLSVDVTKLTAKDIKDLQEEVNGVDRIRVELTGSDKDIRAFDKNRIMSLGIDVKVKEDKIVQEEVEHRVTAHTDLSLLSSFDKFCTKNELDQPVGSRYLKSALNIN